MERQLIIESRMATEQDFLEMCILKLYEKQTEDEQQVRSSTHNNRVGFTRSDGPYFSEIAEYIKEHGHMPAGEMKSVAKRLNKYAGQLVDYLTDKELEE